MQQATEIISHNVSNDADPIRMALFFEEEVQNQIKAVLERWEGTIHVSPGLVNFLEGVHDAHETAIYLINQRVKDSRILGTIERVAARHLRRLAGGQA
jgi:hypothetical protein